MEDHDLIVNIPQSQSFIVGKSVKQELDFKVDQEGVRLECFSVFCYVTESKPNGKTNLAFPDDLLYDANIIDYKLMTGSTANNFIHKSSIMHDAHSQAIEMHNMTSNDSKVD